MSLTHNHLQQLGVVVQGVDVLVGLTCDPITVCIL